MNIASIDAEINRMRIESQIFAYRSQLSENKKKVLELEKNRQLFSATIAELEVKINELEASLG